MISMPKLSPAAVVPAAVTVEAPTDTRIRPNPQQTKEGRHQAVTRIFNRKGAFTIGNRLQYRDSDGHAAGDRVWPNS